jgi:hypothetical protein
MVRGKLSAESCQLSALSPRGARPRIGLFIRPLTGGCGTSSSDPPFGQSPTPGNKSVVPVVSDMWLLESGAAAPAGRSACAPPAVTADAQRWRSAQALKLIADS